MALLNVEILDFLQTQGILGGATDWARAINYIPPNPDQVLAVFTSGGGEPEIVRDGSSETAYDDISFQIRGRGGVFGAEALETKMREIYMALHNGDIGSNYVMVRAMASSPLFLGLDNDSRPEMSWNYRALRER